jgi:muramoyltetrapeptide carboxypeptidase
VELLRAKALRPGDTLGIFTPSSPAYRDCEELFQNGIRNIERLGFKTKLGTLTARRASQGYRSGTPQDRAKEFMDLMTDPQVHGLISTIGGNNSNSMIPFLDFDVIRSNPKVVCGYSDVTSLHLAILKFSGLRTFYGPAAMTWFGDWPDGVSESTRSFLTAVTESDIGLRSLKPFPRWSNHRRSWETGAWKTIAREWKPNAGWLTLNKGEARAPLIAANLSTLIAAAGTKYFPDLAGRILLVESMSAGFAAEERNFRQLHLIGVFDRLAGLLIGKPEWPDSMGAPFSHNDLIMEIIGNRPYPIISEFDCSHTLPMLTLAQMSPVHVVARGGYDTSFECLEPMVS